ncbi:hypothetical protein JTE90_028140 [Oedothorax gibbosus]|uniref:Uncharacterized protein n=1 Tax=Oedothorax gibbosus TaxID=931172 RepID=A0AAV6V9Z2_9ARAC|nr:hypothetical protein JTE90_028140 [Oedothorax gibbosus]
MDLAHGVYTCSCFNTGNFLYANDRGVKRHLNAPPIQFTVSVVQVSLRAHATARSPAVKPHDSLHPGAVTKSL